jgi:hypothetical protein
MAVGRVSSDVIFGHDGEPGCALAGAGDTARGRYHDEVWGTRGAGVRLRRIAPVWAVLALTAAGLLIALALVERDRPWLVLDTGLALVALTGHSWRSVSGACMPNAKSTASSRCRPIR